MTLFIEYYELQLRPDISTVIMKRRIRQLFHYILNTAVFIDVTVCLETESWHNPGYKKSTVQAREQSESTSFNECRKLC